MKIVAFLPAKGSSERIENKNTKILDGKPLFLRQLEKLIDFDFIDEVYLDTESEEIIDMASHLKCKILKRDPSLASNKTDGNKLFYNQIKQVDADIYIQVLCTSPFIKGSTIQKGVDKLLGSDQYDSVVLVRRDKLYTWDALSNRPNYNIEAIPNSMDLSDTLIESMGLYIVKKDTAHRLKRRIGESPYLLNASAIEAIDVNYPDEFELANFIAAGLREKERKIFRNLSHLLTSSILSDIFDELEIDNKIISGLKLNLTERKILGRAKTLKIKAAEITDKTTIYDALNTYSTIVPNDVILVETECPEYAYFGELNTNLAIRSGAIGAIVGGNTRDSGEVKKLQFPVFATGYNCQDIKTKGTVAHYNKRIKINGVVIEPNDLIFGDNEGIVVIPKDKESIVLAMAKDVLKKENSIVSEVAHGLDIKSIRGNHGDF
jgi:regulator of RNase E activity RraA/CMP-N-acetylneuraminic acid synthetase